MHDHTRVPSARSTGGTPRKSVLIVVAGVTLCSGSGAIARAGFTYLTGFQSASGQVQARVLPEGDLLEDSYDLAAPDPLASWSPSSQHITVDLLPFADAAVHASYTSTLTPGRIALEYRATDSHAYTQSPFTGFAQFRVDAAFDLTFHLDAPTLVAVSASLVRGTLEGWNSGTPLSFVFGPAGGSPLVSLAYPGAGPPIWTAEQPLTELALDPGDYTLTALNHNSWQAGRTGSFWDAITCDLHVVPSPASTLLFAMASFVGFRRQVARKSDEPPKLSCS